MTLCRVVTTPEFVCKEQLSPQVKDPIMSRRSKYLPKVETRTVAQMAADDVTLISMSWMSARTIPVKTLIGVYEFKGMI